MRVLLLRTYCECLVTFISNIFEKESPVIHLNLGSDLPLLVGHLPIRAFHLCLFKFGKFCVAIYGGRAV